MQRKALAMTYKTLSIEKKDKICICTINRPEALNALNSNVLDDLDNFLKTLSKDASTRVLILTGAGDKAFVAGADIKEISTLKDKKAAFEFALKGQKVFRQLEKLPQVVIGAINGFALGGGLELALSCDFLVAAPKAKFGLPEVGLGLIPGFGGTQRLSRLVGLARAREMIFSGAHYTAQDALQMGLVNHIVNEAKGDGNSLELALQLAEKMLDKSPLGIFQAKKAINNGFDVDLDKGLEIEAKEFAELFGTTEQKEGIAAFIEKRKPKF
jgi:enoyl-CoA hydratase